MKEVIIELDDMYSEVLSITAIGKHGNITNISTKAVELSKGTILEFDGENWTQRKSKHTGVVLKDEEKEVASDLISRSALIEELSKREYSREKHDFEILIKNQPTAYDVDAVVEELEIYKECNISKTNFSKGYTKAIDDVVKVLIPRLTDAIYPKDVEGMRNLINEVAEQLKERSADNEV